MAELTYEQRQATEHRNGNVLISASAGSGKTHTMIERAVRLILEENVDVNQILAVTFTESAAFDMKEKLKKALSNCKKDLKRLYNQIALIPTSDISTLHSFCARLIRSYFFEVGLSPDFSIMDEVSSKAMKEECVQKTFKEFYDSESQWFYTIVDRHASSRTDKSLKELVLSAYNFCDSEQNPQQIMDNFVEVYSEQNFEDLLSQYKSDLNSQINLLIKDVKYAYSVLKKDVNVKKGAEFTLSLLTDLQIMLEAQDVYVVKKPMESLRARFNFERKLTEEQEQIKELVKTSREKLKKIILRFDKNLSLNKEQERLQLNTLREHTQYFVNILKRFSQIYANEKREENCLDFNDLEHFALQILQNNDIRENIKKKYKHIFVDEYQDINGVQESIISLLENDNLYMVGDIKQSIYGFRGCRPEFFANKFATMQREGKKVLSLNHNFRSAKEVIDMVNKIFCYSMTKEVFGFDYKGNAELVLGGIYPENKTGRAKLHLLEKQINSTQTEKPRIYNILEEIKKPEQIKDNHVVSLLTEIINEELGKTYYDIKEKREKQVGYNDIAILTRNKHNGYVQNLVKGLNQHGISVMSSVKENICDFAEIMMIINALKLIDCFEQDIALASTLLSPIGKFTEEDLACVISAYLDTESAKEDKEWSFLEAYNYYIKNVDTGLSKKLEAFNNYISKLSFSAHFLGAYGTINNLIKDNDIESYLYAQNDGNKKVQRLNRLIQATLDGDKKLTLNEFLNKVESSSDAFTISYNQDEEAVKMMTIHASKGLEFPVVIVCGLERTMADDDDDLLFSRKHGFAFKYYDDEKRIKKDTVLRGVIKEEMQRERVKEELRLFYVATTRATYSLHLTYEGKYNKREEIFSHAERFIDYVPNSVNTIEHTIDEFKFTEVKSQSRKIIISQAEEEVKQKMLKQFEYVYPFEVDTTLPLKLSVTKAMNTDEQNLVHLIFDEPMPDKESGTIAHKIMENFDFDSKFNLYEQIGQMIDKGVLNQEQVDKVNIERIQNAINSGVFDCIKATKLYREKVFLMQIEAKQVLQTLSEEKVVLQGIIDLLSIKDDSAIVIDYKYSSLDKESLKRQYHKQLELYSQAVHRVLEKNIKKMIIVNLFTGETIEI